MFVEVSFCGTDFPNIQYTVTTDSTAEDVLNEAVQEWEIDINDVEVTFESEILPRESTLVSHGIQSETELVVIQKPRTVYTRDMLLDKTRRVDIDVWFRGHCDAVCTLDVISMIEDGQLMTGYWLLPRSIYSVQFTSGRKLEKIGKDFLRNCSSVTRVDLSNFESCVEVSDGFLAGCLLLESIDLSSFSKLRATGDNFLGCCAGITSIDLSMITLSNIGQGFLVGCSSVCSLILPQFQITSIPSSFLAGCTSLTAVNLNTLEGVREIGSCFLFGCVKLLRIDLSPFSNVSKISNEFLADCNSLTNLDLSPLSNLTSLGYGFLYCKRSSKLRSLDLSNLESLTSVAKPNFLGNCRVVSDVEKKNFIKSTNRRGLQQRRQTTTNRTAKEKLSNCDIQ